ncbi:MAG: hypothetical protein IPK53_11310 [bacterium]|nr:hypothetical protein [bacterium]
MLFHHKRHPAVMGAAEIDAFLAHLAVYNHITPPPKKKPGPRRPPLSLVMSSNNPSKHLLPTRNPFLPEYPRGV